MGWIRSECRVKKSQRGHFDQGKEADMETRKQQYIDQTRTNTAYPNYRRFVGIVAILGYVLAGLLVLITLLASIEAFSVGQYREGFTFLIGSVIVAIIIVFVSRLLKEPALIFADIADSITDANSRMSYGQ